MRPSAPARDVMLREAKEALQREEWERAVRGFVLLLTQNAARQESLEFNLSLARRRWCADRRTRPVKVAVCGWELSHNAAGRVRTLVDIWSGLAETEVIGATFQRWGQALWGPIREGKEAHRTFHVDDESQFPKAAMELVLAHPYDVVHLSKPRWPNIVLGLLYKIVWGSRVVVDVDDEELGAVAADSIRDLESLVREHGGLPRWQGLGQREWTRAAVGLWNLFDDVTVSNDALQRRYGGWIVPHARDQRRFTRSSRQRMVSRERFGIPRDKLVVLFFGTPRRHKGLVETARALASSGLKDVCFVIVGTFQDPALKDEVLAVEGVDVRTLPDQPYESAANVVALGDICVLLQSDSNLLSAYQFPAKLIDALAMELLVFADRTPALSEVIEAGAVVETTAESLADDMARVLLDQSACERTRTCGRALFLERYSLKAARLQLQGLWDREGGMPVPGQLLSHRQAEVFGTLGRWGMFQPLADHETGATANDASDCTARPIKKGGKQGKVSGQYGGSAATPSRAWGDDQSDGTLARLLSEWPKVIASLERAEVTSGDKIREKVEWVREWCPSVMVGTLASGENELEKCVQSVKRQAYPAEKLEHVVIRDLPKKEAMDTLYTTFLDSGHDLLVKLDADMVILDRSFIAKVTRAFCSTENLGMLQAAILDYFSGREMQGINIYSKEMKWATESQDALFTDKTQTEKSRRRVTWATYIDSVIHSPDPSEFQAFHFGVHRGLKVAAAVREDGVGSARALEQLMYLERTYEHYKNRRDVRLLAACLGGELGMREAYNVEALNYTNADMRTSFSALRATGVEAMEARLQVLRETETTDSMVESARRERRSLASRFEVESVVFLLPHLGLYGGVNRFVNIASVLLDLGIDVRLAVPKSELEKSGTTTLRDVPIISLETAAEATWDVAVSGDFSSGVTLTLAHMDARVIGTYLLNGWAHRERNLSQIRAVDPDIIFANSSYAMDCYPELAPAALVGAVDLSVFRRPGAVRPADGVTRVLVPAGRFKPRKRFVDAQVAVENLYRDGYHVELHVLNATETSVATDVPCRVHVGLSASGVAELMKYVDVVVCPEEDAGWNNPAAEAMASGTPVICTEAGTTDFAFDGATAMLVQRRAPKEIEAALRRLIEDPVLRETIGSAARDCIEEFSWESLGRKFLRSTTQCRPRRKHTEREKWRGRAQARVNKLLKEGAEGGWSAW